MRPAREEPPRAALQLAIALDPLRLRGICPVERSEVIAFLASLLMQAAGVAAQESDDDRT
jgi:hypothetical protein